MEGLSDNESNKSLEAGYLAWKSEYEMRRTARAEMKQAAQKETVRVPMNPQKFFDGAMQQGADARIACHVAAESTQAIFDRIDALLEAS